MDAYDTVGGDKRKDDKDDQIWEIDETCIGPVELFCYSHTASRTTAESMSKSKTAPRSSIDSLHCDRRHDSPHHHHHTHQQQPLNDSKSPLSALIVGQLSRPVSFFLLGKELFYASKSAVRRRVCVAGGIGNIPHRKREQNRKASVRFRKRVSDLRMQSGEMADTLRT